jgi:hypothetical protein
VGKFGGNNYCYIGMDIDVERRSIVVMSVPLVSAKAGRTWSSRISTSWRALIGRTAYLTADSTRDNVDTHP